jgi:NAD(P)-dependent dehydrogenase (short-subunit alcohol dehydrogenase family)
MPTALVTGASRGIGLEFVRQLAGSWRVIATCRSPSTAEGLLALQATHANITVEQLDVTNDEQIEALAQKLASTPIDLLVLNAGIKGSREQQHLGALKTADLMEVLRVNTVAPLLVAQAFTPHVKASQRKQIVCCSSGVGCIGDNTSGGMTQYRVSKAGLNMGMQEIAVKGREEGVHVLCLVPGWVRTDMGGPNGRLSPEESVGGLLSNVVHQYRSLQSGGLYDYTGKLWPW